MREDNSEYRAQWAADRPRLPLPLVDGSVSSTSLEMFINPELWPMKGSKETIWDMTQPVLCGFFIPPFQRPLVWDDTRKAAFVESAYLGLHLGTIVFNDAMDFPLVNGQFDRTDRWLIDGQQRLNALWTYVHDDLPVFVGAPNEHRWSELNQRERRTFEFIQIGTSRLKTRDEQRLRLIYDRLNFGGVPHTDDQRALPKGA